jgi:site-specific DNA-cytosine methylase
LNLAPVRSRVTHFHLFSGAGIGARGMQEANARVGQLEAEMECLGGIDVDPSACADFERLLGVKATCADLFDREQFMAWHATCMVRRKRCHACLNTGQPPPGWRPFTGADILAAAGFRFPDIVFLSSPCKGLSGLQTPSRAQSDAYQALNRLTVRGVKLMLEAFESNPPSLIVFENVPLIATRGRALLDEIRDLLFLHGYAVAETFHDCGELGGLAQRRRRFLLVARHRQKVPPFLYEPPKQRLKGVGEVIGELPLPDADGAGPMHRCPRLTWETWIRLALIPAGGDWRSLEGMDFTKLGIEPIDTRDWGGGDLGVTPWTSPAGTVSGGSRPRQGAYSVQDPRPTAVQDGAQRTNDVFRVVDWTDQAGAVTSGTGPSSGGQSVSDPRNGHHGRYQTYRVIRFDEPAPTVTAQSEPGGGGYTVADPRVPSLKPGTGFDSQQAGKWEVTPYDEPARTVIAANGTGTGASAVADPCVGLELAGGWGGGRLGVNGWGDSVGAVTAEGYPTNGAFSVADPRLGSYGQHGSKLRVEGWGTPAHTVTTSDRVGSGAMSVADPRVPMAKIPAFHDLCRVEPWDQPAHSITGGTRPAGGALSVADPRIIARDPRVAAKARRDDFKSSGHYGVVSWTESSHAVTAHGQHDNGAFSVADPRPLPGPLDRLDPVPVIIALDGTWHRPFTTLDLAALQFGADLALELMARPLSGTSHTTWREHIGNAVPRASARAIGSEMARTILMARSGQTFRLASTPIWVQPLAIAMALDSRPPLETR